MTHQKQSETPDPGWCGDPRRGASLGRRSDDPQGWPDNSKLYLAMVRLDSGGYDPGGSYWGIYQRLYETKPVDHEGHSYFFRAASRNEAKQKLLDINRTFRFFA